MRRAVRAIVIKDDQLLAMRRDKFGSQYYILIGGGVELNESLEQALLREIQEETGMQVTNPRLVFVEDAGEMYGVQHIFVCDYVSGEPVLHPDSQEAHISAMGSNMYTPLWLPFADFATVPFRSDRLRKAVLDGIQHGFPDAPVDITNLYHI